MTALSESAATTPSVQRTLPFLSLPMTDDRLCQRQDMRVLLALPVEGAVMQVMR